MSGIDTARMLVPGSGGGGRSRTGPRTVGRREGGADWRSGTRWDVVQLEAPRHTRVLRDAVVLSASVTLLLLPGITWGSRGGAQTVLLLAMPLRVPPTPCPVLIESVPLYQGSRRCTLMASCYGVELYCHPLLSYALAMRSPGTDVQCATTAPVLT